jgi:prolyl oligopeptidase
MSRSQFVSRLVGVLGATSIGIAAAALPSDPPPVAQVKPVTTDYFGTPVVDPYRYLEDLSDPAVQAWMKEQNNYTRARLLAIPGRKALLADLRALNSTDIHIDTFIRRGQRYFYLATEPGADLPKLYYRDGFQGSEHLLMDPAALGKGTSTHYELDFYQPSWDGRFIAYGVSAGGSEKSFLHVMEVDNQKLLAEDIDRTTDSSLAWRPDNRSFFYMRFNKPGPDTPPSDTEYNGRAYLHKVGTNANGDGDPVVFGRGVSSRLDVPKGPGAYIVLSADSSYAIAIANHNMDDNPGTLYVASIADVKGADTPWRKIADVSQGVTTFEARGDKLYFLSQLDAPRSRLLSTPLAHPDISHPTVVVPEGKNVITGFAISRDGIYLREREGALSRLVRVGFGGEAARTVPLPFDGGVTELIADSREPGVSWTLESWTHPSSLFSYDPQNNVSQDTKVIPPSKFDTSGLESKEVMVTSFDGTQVPLSIIYKRGLKLDATHPTMLQGYGSYGQSLDPVFRPQRVAWLNQNGVFAIAHVRGGGELGNAWHTGGLLLTKPNTVSDFIACGEYLVDQHYTTPKLLAGIGGSAGGITVGGALTRRPDLFGVILDEVGASDTLRAETEPNGPPNIVEFGSTATELGFHELYAMSAYMHVRQGTAYPAVMFTTGANDPRVAPWQMLKMTARVQAATSSGRPVLLRVDYDAGHGIGSSMTQHEEETADTWSFALWQMGEPEFQPPSGP